MVARHGAEPDRVRQRPDLSDGPTGSQVHCPKKPCRDAFAVAFKHGHGNAAEVSVRFSLVTPHCIVQPLLFRLATARRSRVLTNHDYRPVKRSALSALLVLASALFRLPAALPAPQHETIRFGHFGAVAIYRPAPHPSHVALLISGDSGWDPTMVKMAQALETAGTLVVGVDIRRYVNAVDATAAKCAYPSGDFEPLSHFVEKVLGFPNYIRPVLVGYQSGATLAYAVLVQSPAGTFQGAVSLGFRPVLSMSKPFCPGNDLAWARLPSGLSFRPSKDLQAPWIVLQGAEDRVFSPSETKAYINEVKGAELVTLPRIGGRFRARKRWIPPFLAAFKKIVEHPPTERAAEAPEVRDLPLVEIPASEPASNTFAVVLSGDGGWAGLDRSLGSSLADNGIAVVGLNSLQYFWHRRTPETAGRDLERLLEHYLAAWNKQQVILIGYSFGADVLPFMADRLPPELKAKTKLVALLGPSTWAEFEFHLTDWIGDYDRKSSLAVLPEIEKLQGMNILCICGEEEVTTPCLKLEMGNARVISLGGGHHFNGDYQALSASILAAIR